MKARISENVDVLLNPRMAWIRIESMSPVISAAEKSITLRKIISLSPLMGRST